MLRNDAQKIVLTGGHAGSTAFVVIEEIRRQKKNWQLFWIGFKGSFEGKNIPSLSSLYFPKYDIKTYGIIMGRLQRKLSLYTLPALFKIPIGFVHALVLLLRIEPDLILSFGGFSAFPVVVVGFLLRIPVILHEQTAVAGRANKYSSFFAKKIAISRDTSYTFFPKEKTVLIGNPVPRDIVRLDPKRPLPEFPTIFITGGQSGSSAINSQVEKSLSKMLERFKVTHLAGIKEVGRFKDIRNTLESDKKARYRVYGVVDPKDYNLLFNSADLLVSRAGANTVGKILLANKPSILIPLPISYLAEQKKNAIYAQRFGIARVIPQNDFSEERLFKEIDYIIGHWYEILAKVAKKESPDVGAAEKLVDLMEEEIK